MTARLRQARLNQTARCGKAALERTPCVGEELPERGKAMSDMNSGRVPATIVFSALLVVILVSSSRTTYTLAPAKDPARQNAVATGCGAPPTLARQAAEPRDE